ncbi:hypothetical protein [Streptomyces afghaniensis]|nr:hypothetical protein [Streptomyces afghaniensis]
MDGWSCWTVRCRRLVTLARLMCRDVRRTGEVRGARAFRVGLYHRSAHSDSVIGVHRHGQIVRDASRRLFGLGPPWSYE